VEPAAADRAPPAVAFVTLLASGGERPGAKTRVRGINLAAAAGAWAEGFQAWEGTWETAAATTNLRWDASWFGFTGREHELEAGLVYERARYLNPSTGAWTRADPMSFADGPNRYAYVRGQATAVGDPLGLFATAIHNHIIGQAADRFSVLTAEDRAALIAASREADSSEYQDPVYSYRHGMTAPSQGVSDAIMQWMEFIDASLAVGAVNYSCEPTFKAIGLKHLGFGLHAAVDVESPVHRFKRWNFFDVGAVIQHIAYEQMIRATDSSVTDAISMASTYLDTFATLRKLSGRFGDLQTMQGLAMALYGQYARLHAMELYLLE